MTISIASSFATARVAGLLEWAIRFSAFPIRLAPRLNATRACGQPGGAAAKDAQQ